MAADRQANSAGPATIAIGSMTIKLTGNTRIEGVKKIYLTKDRRIALSFAGNTGDHTYLTEFLESNSPSAAMRTVRVHMESQYDFEMRDLLLEAKPQMENQVLLSFFDSDRSAYFTNMSFFTRLATRTGLDARKLNPMPILCHVGSGSNEFENAVGIDEIRKFIGEVKGGADLPTQLQWFATAFESVSKIAAGCGSSFDAVLSTRQKPEFEYVHCQSAPGVA